MNLTMSAMHTFYLFIKKMYHHGLPVSSPLALFLNQYVKTPPFVLLFFFVWIFG